MKYRKYILSPDDSRTEIDDIGKNFGGEILTDRAYSGKEDCCVRIIEYLMKINGAASLRIGELSKYDNSHEKKYRTLYGDGILSLKRRLAEGYKVDKKYVGDVVRLMLRGDIWCRLYAQNVHFVADAGYDFSMHIICRKMKNREFKNVQAVMSKALR